MRAIAVFPSLRRWGVVGILTICAAAVGVTFALADNSPSSTTYYACVNNSSGTIQMVAGSDTCHANEHKIEWNQSGPAGPAGVPGTPGKDGKDGSNGLSEAYVVRTGARNFQIIDSFNSSLVVAQLTDLPAGSYVVTAEETTSFPSGIVGGGGQANGVVNCGLTPGSAHGSQGVQVGGLGATSAQSANVTLTDGVTLASAGDIQFKCSGPLGLSSSGAVLTAIPVNTLHDQTGALDQDANFTASISGHFVGDPQACSLILNGYGLKPNSEIMESIGDDTSQHTIPDASGDPARVGLDGTINVLAPFQFEPGTTLTATEFATTVAGGTISSVVTVDQNCGTSAPVATLSATLDGPFIGAEGCRLILSGANLYPGSGVTYTVTGGGPQALIQTNDSGGNAGPVVVAADGTLNTTTMFGYPATGSDATTLSATSVLGGTVTASFSSNASCEGSSTQGG